MGEGVYDISAFNVDEATYIPSAEEIEIFEAARALNPKPYRTRRPNKCATIDCDYMACHNSIFCRACDNERLRPILADTTTMADYHSGSPSGEIALRRRALRDQEKGISKAIL